MYLFINSEQHKESMYRFIQLGSFEPPRMKSAIPRAQTGRARTGRARTGRPKLPTRPQTVANTHLRENGKHN